MRSEMSTLTRTEKSRSLFRNERITLNDTRVGNFKKLFWKFPTQKTKPKFNESTKDCLAIGFQASKLKDSTRAEIRVSRNNAQSTLSLEALTLNSLVSSISKIWI